MKNIHTIQLMEESIHIRMKKLEELLNELLVSH